MARKKAETNGHAVEPPPAPTPPDPEPEHEPNTDDHFIDIGNVFAKIRLVQTDKGPRHNVSVGRRYVGTDGLVYVSYVFSFRDLLPLAKALDLAHSHINEKIIQGDSPF